ncbi:MAG: hypothetical protein NTV83_05870 [Aeromonas sp.]|nr:hypothetical protein [Aeromonas sp.]MCX7131561.1 hypothetical protein [Aeromonas sp.]
MFRGWWSSDAVSPLLPR